MQEAAGTLRVHRGTKRVVEAALRQPLPSETRTKMPTPKRQRVSGWGGKERRGPSAEGVEVGTPGG